LDVSVAAVAHAPTLTVADASGAEDSAIALSINPARTDTDGSESLSVTVSGVDSGAVLGTARIGNGKRWRVRNGCDAHAIDGGRINGRYQTKIVGRKSATMNILKKMLYLRRAVPGFGKRALTFSMKIIVSIWFFGEFKTHLSIGVPRPRFIA